MSNETPLSRIQNLILSAIAGNALNNSSDITTAMFHAKCEGIDIKPIFDKLALAAGRPDLRISDFLARRHHYLFSHTFLKENFFSDPKKTIEGFRSLGAEYARLIWTLGGKRLPPNEVMSPEGLGCQVKELPHDISLAVITLPPPKRVPETYFVALVYRSDHKFLMPREGLKRYFTLEFTAPSQDEHRTVLCERTEDGSHCNYGSGLAPTVAGFSDSLIKFFKQ